MEAGHPVNLSSRKNPWLQLGPQVSGLFTAREEEGQKGTGKPLFSSDGIDALGRHSVCTEKLVVRLLVAIPDGNLAEKWRRSK